MAAIDASSGSAPGPSPLAVGERQLSVAEARAAIAAHLRPITDGARVPLDTAVGRVLAADLLSPIDVPAHDNSAMDGYAFDGLALQADAPTRLHVVGVAYAGAPWVGQVGRGEGVRIMTGAVMPQGLDTVVPHELCDLQGDEVRIPPGILRAGDNRRHRAEDLTAGKPALAQGRRLTPADLGLMASLGIDSVEVLRPLRVALFSTGDELRTLGQSLDAGCIYDSNRHTLMAVMRRLGLEVVDLGLVGDDPAALRQTLQTATAMADVVLTTGGVSMGDADHTRDVLAEVGKVAFWKVAMRPGRPFAFGPLQRADGAAPVLLFALPGNPVAALVTFYALVRDALLRLAGAAGASAQPVPMLQVRSAQAIRKRPGRTEFQRGIVEADPVGGWQVRLTGSQGAGVLRSMSEANALIVLAHEQGSVEQGQMVDVWLFEGIG